MIAKFFDVNSDSAIEFRPLERGLFIYAVTDPTNPLEESIGIELDTEDLFELIGHLLKIQAKLKDNSKSTIN